jgi:hypothetical protein
VFRKKLRLADKLIIGAAIKTWEIATGNIFALESLATALGNQLSRNRTE